ncbi:MAG: hypothetical protein RLZZ127_1587 [Planctomycetota bacterium]|jgi:hypothetical protein
MLKLAILALVHGVIPFLYHWIRPYGFPLPVYGLAMIAATLTTLVAIWLTLHGVFGPATEAALWGVLTLLAILATHVAFVVWGGLRTPPPAFQITAPAPAPATAPAAEIDWITVQVYASAADHYLYMRDRARLEAAGIPFRVLPAGAAALQVAAVDAERACAALGLDPEPVTTT